LHEIIPISRRIPDRYQLQQNYPNPFNAATQIFFALPKAGRVQVNIFSIDGRCVRRLLDQQQEAGSHMIVWNGCDDQQQSLPSGLYICRLHTEGVQLSRKMQMIK
jgi:flagellar hook assembly protein FlgD